jgi:two-component system C4-dicarboxylate transport sensor histidine kinase DctB
MFQLLANNADTLAFIQGALLLTLATVVFLLGRTQAWSIPSKTLSLFFILLGLRLWTRIIRFNTELGPHGAIITLVFTALAGLVLIEFLRRSRTFTMSPKQTAIAFGTMIAVCGIPPLVSVNALGTLVPMIGISITVVTFGLIWLNARHDINPKGTRLFWLGVLLYLTSYIATPLGSADINAHMPELTTYHYSLSFLPQLITLLFPLSVAFFLLYRRFQTLGLTTQLTQPLRLGLDVWVTTTMIAAIAAATLLGNKTKQDEQIIHQDGLKAFTARIEQMTQEGKTHLAILTASERVLAIATNASNDRIEASRKLEKLCRTPTEMICYLINATGETIATSNWNTSTSFLGKNYGFRDYFRNALATGEGYQIAKGVTSFVPGLYVARRINSDSTAPMVFVTKLNLLPTVEGYSEHQSLFLIDTESNILLTNDDDAVGKRLFPDATHSESYLGLKPEDHHRFLYEGKTARFRTRPFSFPGTHLAAVQLDNSPTARLLGFGFGVPLLLSAMLSSLLITLLFIGNQERLTSINRVRSLERENAETRTMLFHNEKLASLGILSAGVAHEVNNPLTIVTTSLFRLREMVEKATDWPERDKATIHLARAERSAERIAGIVRKLLALARIDKAGNGRFDLQVVVNDTTDMLQYLFEKEGIEFSVILGDRPINLEGNASELGQILLNLLTNAKDAIAKQEQRKIILAVEEQESSVLVRCIDNGPGVPKEVQKRIFDPFFTTKEMGKGTGLGLSISHQIAASMGGSLTLESTEGKGATFILTIPKGKTIKST